MKKLDRKDCTVIAYPAGNLTNHVNNNAFQNYIATDLYILVRK
jgi:hypothetical protein